MDNEATKALCLALIRADSEKEVIELLAAGGFWENAACWRWLGDEEYNYSSVGNQQSRAEQAVVEKLINSIDAKLIGEARLSGLNFGTTEETDSSELPDSIWEARERFFGHQLDDLERLSRSITVAATGAKPREGTGRPCFTIVDDGEGQTPLRMPETILSLHRGNKDKIKFVQGKFNMGGTGVLEFCGLDRNLQLVVSRRNPQLIGSSPAHASDTQWSFSVVRREDPTDGKSSRFTYLAPTEFQSGTSERGLLSFAANSMPLFPEKNKPYARESQWGTLIKLYEYNARRFGTNMMVEDGLMYRVRLLIPEPALPIRFHECRTYRGDPNRSFDTTMMGLTATLQRDFDNPKRDNVEWFDKIQFDVDGELFEGRIYLFKNKEAADAYRKDEGIVFTYNGQSHATMTKDFFRRRSVKQDYLWHSLLVLLDCSRISRRAHEKLFMNSRDRLRDDVLKARVEKELEEQLGTHRELRELASERRKRELAEKPKTSEAMAKVIEQLIYKNPMLASLLGQGLRIRNPHRPEGAEGSVAGFIGKRFPTRFHFKGLDEGRSLEREANLNSRVRITFETDAANDYFRRIDQPGDFVLYQLTNGEKREAINYRRPSLHDGFASISLALPSGATDGEELTFEAVVEDPSRIEPFRNIFVLNVKPERSKSTGGPGKPVRSSDDERGDGGPDRRGDKGSRDMQMDIPEPIPVFESTWTSHDPAFDKFTAMRIKERPDEEETRYDYFINMDNIYLQSYLKAKPKDSGQIKLRYSVAMTLVALSVLHQDHIRKGVPNSNEDFPDATVDVRNRVAQTTSALAPFLLPMIESVGEIEGDDQHLSESA